MANEIWPWSSSYSNRQSSRSSLNHQSSAAKVPDTDCTVHKDPEPPSVGTWWHKTHSSQVHVLFMTSQQCSHTHSHPPGPKQSCPCQWRTPQVKKCIWSVCKCIFKFTKAPVNFGSACRWLLASKAKQNFNSALCCSG